MTTTVDPPVDTPEPGPRPRRSRTATVAAVVVAVILAGLVWILATNPNAGERRDSASLVGHPAPQIEARTLDGGRFDSEAGRGRRFLLVNFFATWCVPCRQEHPELVKFADQQRGLGLEGAELYTVVVDDDASAVEEFFADEGGDWPVVYDDDGRFAVAFGVAKVPETWIIDPNGVVRGRVISQVTAEFLGTQIQRLREGA